MATIQNTRMNWPRHKPTSEYEHSEHIVSTTETGRVHSQIDGIMFEWIIQAIMCTHNRNSRKWYPARRLCERLARLHINLYSIVAFFLTSSVGLFSARTNKRTWLDRWRIDSWCSCRLDAAFLISFAFPRFINASLELFRHKITLLTCSKSLFCFYPFSSLACSLAFFPLHCFIIVVVVPVQ